MGVVVPLALARHPEQAWPDVMTHRVIRGATALPISTNGTDPKGSGLRRGEPLQGAPSAAPPTRKPFPTPVSLGALAHRGLEPTRVTLEAHPLFGRSRNPNAIRDPSDKVLARGAADPGVAESIEGRAQGDDVAVVDPAGLQAR